VNVGQAEIDWLAYNTKPNICHPSAQGYDAIAKEIYNVLKENNR
jgi:lysophospholipase L1-like esterase